LILASANALESIADLSMATIRDNAPATNMRVYGANELYLANLKALKSLAPLPPIVPLLTTVKIFGLDALTSLEGWKNLNTLKNWY